MSASTKSSGPALSLHGAPNRTDKDSTSSRCAILVRLNEQIVRELQQCSQAAKAVQLLGGKTPRIRYGAKLLELTVKPETFRHEIYSADEAASTRLGFAAVVSHCGETKAPAEKARAGDAGADAALAALKQSLASMAKQKEERKATIVSNNSKSHNSARQALSLHNRSNSSSSSTPRPAAPTSAPSDPQTKAKETGMRFAVIHLLALSPASEQDIHDRTRIPRAHLAALLPKVADKRASEWELFNKSYKEVDPWTFRYTSHQRQTAIDNAIRAFDRQRVPRDDKAWQALLPKEERGKGKVLSRLNLGVERRDQQIGTPGLAPTPVHMADRPAGSAANTPKTGGAGTPRGAATATGRSAAGISIEKRLKEARKKGALEKKKQERGAKEAAAAVSDRESKPRTIVRKALPKKLPAKVKSDEVVHSSDDEDDDDDDDNDDEEGEVKEAPRTTKPKDAPRTAAKPRPAPERRESSASEASRTSKELPAQLKSRPKPSTAISAAVKKESAVSRPKADPVKASQTGSATRRPENVAAAKASARPRDSPLQQPVRPVTAAHRATPTTQASPRKYDATKPKVPSPLGTSSPRNAASRADKPTKPVPTKASKPSTSAASSKAAKSAASAKTADVPVSFFGDGVKSVTKTKVVTKKRALDTDNDTPEPARKIMRPGASSNARPPSATTTAKRPAAEAVGGTKNGNAKPSATTATTARPVANADKTLKRKANEHSSGLRDQGVPVTKHRKTDSGSTHSHAPTNSSITSLTTAPTISPAHSSPSLSDSSRDDYFANILDEDYDGGVLTWEQARGAADWFRTKMYPAYLELYKRIDSTPPEKVQEEEKSRLWALHHRLEAVKHRIEVACGSGEN